MKRSFVACEAFRLIVSQSNSEIRWYEFSERYLNAHAGSCVQVDIWAVGIMLHEFFCGQPAIRARSRDDLKKNVRPLLLLLCDGCGCCCVMAAAGQVITVCRWSLSKDFAQIVPKQAGWRPKWVQPMCIIWCYVNCIPCGFASSAAVEWSILTQLMLLLTESIRLRQNHSRWMGQIQDSCERRRPERAAVSIAPAISQWPPDCQRDPWSYSVPLVRPRQCDQSCWQCRVQWQCLSCPHW